MAHDHRSQKYFLQTSVELQTSLGLPGTIPVHVVKNGTRISEVKEEIEKNAASIWGKSLPICMQKIVMLRAYVDSDIVDWEDSNPALVIEANKLYARLTVLNACLTDEKKAAAEDPLFWDKIVSTIMDSADLRKRKKEFFSFFPAPLVSIMTSYEGLPPDVCSPLALACRMMPTDPRPRPLFYELPIRYEIMFALMPQFYAKVGIAPQIAFDKACMQAATLAMFESLAIKLDALIDDPRFAKIKDLISPLSLAKEALLKQYHRDCILGEQGLILFMQPILDKLLQDINALKVHSPDNILMTQFCDAAGKIQSDYQHEIHNIEKTPAPSTIPIPGQILFPMGEIQKEVLQLKKNNKVLLGHQLEDKVDRIIQGKTPLGKQKLLFEQLANENSALYKMLIHPNTNVGLFSPENAMQRIEQQGKAKYGDAFTFKSAIKKALLGQKFS